MVEEVVRLNEVIDSLEYQVEVLAEHVTTQPHLSESKLHLLWGKAKDHPDYVKSEWRQMQYQVELADRLLKAIKEHHDQKADDRCWMDDDKLYTVAALPTVDRRVGDKFEMAKNCLRFIERRCEGGVWPSYTELETRIKDQEQTINRYEKALSRTITILRARDDPTGTADTLWKELER